MYAPNIYLFDNVAIDPSALKKERREMVEPELTDAQCGFPPGRSTMDPFFENSRTHVKQVNALSWALELNLNRKVSLKTYTIISVNTEALGW